jgi:hypothetical protein
VGYKYRHGKKSCSRIVAGHEPFAKTPTLLWSTESGELLKKNDSPELKANGCGFLSDGRVVYSTMNGKELQV